jgi:DNA repair protein RecO (recombination protein O)
MPLFTTDALILRSYKLGESDRIVVFLTRDRGKKRGVAHNALRSRRRFGGALEPLTRGRISYVEREHRDLVRLEYVEPISSPMAAADADALAYSCYFAELIDEWAPEADPNEPLFRLGASIVEALVGGAPVEPLARYFEYWLLRLQGVYEPDVPMSAEARTFLEGVRTSSPFVVGDLSVSKRALREIESRHRDLMAAHLEKDLRSARVLREMRMTAPGPGTSRS